MPDFLDLVQDQMEREDEARAALLKPYDIPPGVAGECHGCGDHFPRLINDHCGGCRDKLRMT